MAINSDIRDQAYQFFVEEAPELLQLLESGLLNLTRERSVNKIHDLMRAAHSLKGGASSVGLEEIATLAHRLENIFKALYGETVDIDADLENQLLQAYDCLRLPLMEQITTGSFDAEAALEIADPILTRIEAQFGDAIGQADSYIPSSADLGVDMVASIFEVDVAQGLEHLAMVVLQPQEYEVAGEVRAQAEVFAGFAELLNLPEFGAIAETVLQALDLHSDHAQEIAQLALTDFERSRQAVLEGDRQGTGPSAALLGLIDPTVDAADFTMVSAEAFMSSAEAFVDDASIFTGDVETFASDTEAFMANVEAFVDDAETFTGDAEVLVDDTETFTSDTETFTSDAEAVHQDLQDVAVSIPILETMFGNVESDLDTDELDSHSEVDADLLVPEYSEALEPTVEEVASHPDASDLLVPEYSAFEPTNLLQGLETTTEPADTLDDAEITAQTLDALESLKATFQALEAIDAIDTDVESEHLPDALETAETPEAAVESANVPENLEMALKAIEQIFDRLPPLETTALDQALVDAELSETLAPAEASIDEALPVSNAVELSPPASKRELASLQADASTATGLTVRVDSDRLERMNNLVGELAINRDGLSLQNEQLQRGLRELLNRFSKFQNLVESLRELSDQMLVAPERYGYAVRSALEEALSTERGGFVARSLAPSYNPTASLPASAEFDPLEMDSYGELHTQLQDILENMVQLEETVDDITLFTTQSNQMLDQQRQMLSQLRNEVMWARMLPLGEILNRFPRVLRDLSATYHKPVGLTLTGTGVLVEKAILEKLYDPLLHLLRNAFDHGIEPPEIRRMHGKPEQGRIEIRAYRKGNQTVIELADDGQGLNLDRIRQRVLERRWLSAEVLDTLSPAQLGEFIFEPGFSTAAQVSELSGRGVGLDVVRSQLRSIKGTVSVTSTPGQGTVFTLSLPLTLTIAKLLVCLVGSAALALPTDNIEEILAPQIEQIQQSGEQRYINWREQIIPIYRLADLLHYACPLPEAPPNRLLSAIASPKNWSAPMLVMRQEQQIFALEVDRLVTEQELVVKPFSTVISAPNYTYGCTILGDGSLVPVIDGIALLDFKQEQKINPVEIAERVDALNGRSAYEAPKSTKTMQTPTVLVVDDSATLRRTLALSMKRAGFRVLQAQDGREAIEQLQQSQSVQLVICDIEMPNMNGFEFLNYRRQDSELAKTPIVMLTSRSNNKHRWLAMQLGASAYFTKPYVEQEFLATIRNIMSLTS